MKNKAVRIIIIVAAIIAALAVVAISVIMAYLGKVSRGSELGSDIGINTELTTEGVQNIALLGLDSRSDDEAGRTDAIIILTIDRTHNKIKLSTIARDSFVAVDGFGYKKITDCFAYGKVNLTVKTINQNFGMNIADYVYVNFYEFVELIDYIGGVDIDVNESEQRVMNTKYIPELNELGIACEQVPSVGVQRLTGGQALAYARDRYSGGTEFERGNRHKEVLEAMFTQMKSTPVTKLVGVINKILPMCHTNLTNSEMLSIATWALTDQPSMEQLSLPTKECNIQMGDRGDGYGDVVRFDLGVATEVLYDFVYEPSVEESQPTE